MRSSISLQPHLSVVLLWLISLLFSGHLLAQSKTATRLAQADTALQKGAFDEAFRQYSQIVLLDSNQQKRVQRKLQELFSAIIRKEGLSRMQKGYVRVQKGEQTYLLDARGIYYRYAHQWSQADSTTEILDLSEQMLRQLPPEISRCKQLRFLWLNGNRLKRLPASIGHLRELLELEADFNQLQALPSSLGRLKRLRKLSLAHNQLLNLPDSLGQLSALRICVLSHNQLEQLPLSIGKWQQLQKLYLNHNALTALPEPVAQLHALRLLTLQNNRLRAFPKVLYQLPDLALLQLSGNAIDAKELQEAQAQLPSTTKIIN